MREGEGNCCDQTRLQIALSRSIDIPSINIPYKEAHYIFAKVQYKNSKSSIGHVWALYHINNKWLPSDTTSQYNKFGKPSTRYIILKYLKNVIELGF